MPNGDQDAEGRVRLPRGSVGLAGLRDGCFEGTVPETQSRGSPQSQRPGILEVPRLGKQPSLVHRLERGPGRS